MNIYLNMLRAAGKLPVFEKPNEGGNGGGGADDDAAKKAAEDAAAAKAAEDAAKKAQDDADEAARKAAADPTNAELQKLSTEKAELLKEVMDKKTKLKDAQAEAAAAKAALAAYEGIDPAEVKALVKAKKDSEVAAAEARGDFDRVKQMMADEHAKATKSLQDQIADLTNQLQSKNSAIDELTIGNAFGNSTYIKDNLVLSSDKTRQLYGSHFEMKDGVLVGYNKSASAKDRTLLVDAAGEPLPFDKALERVIDADADKKTVLKSLTKPGSGSSPQQPVDKNKPAPKDDGLFGRTRLAAALKGEF